MSSEFTIQRASWESDRDTLATIRRTVFIDEQQVPEDLEWDGFDETSIHLLTLDSHGEAVATARLMATGQLGRMAVLCPFRGRGVGRALLQAAIAIAKQEQFETLFLHAQTHAVAFYAKQGFVCEGDEYEEAGIPHHSMHLILKD